MSKKSSTLSDKEFDRLSVPEALEAMAENRTTVAQTERLLAMASVAGAARGALPPGAEPVPMDEETRKRLVAMGIDPSQAQLVRMPKGSEHGPDDMVQTANGLVAWKDIPKGDDGLPTAEWIEENCACDEHTAKRAGKAPAAAAAVGGPNDGAERYSGGYI